MDSSCPPPCVVLTRRGRGCVQGRMFDDHLLDMVEFGVDSYQPIASFSVRVW